MGGQALNEEGTAQRLSDGGFVQGMRQSAVAVMGHPGIGGLNDLRAFTAFNLHNRENIVPILCPCSSPIIWSPNCLP